MFQEAWNLAVKLAKFFIERDGRFCARYSDLISLLSLIIAVGMIALLILAIGAGEIYREGRVQGILTNECGFLIIFYLRFCEASVKGVSTHVFAMILVASIIGFLITFVRWVQSAGIRSKRMLRISILSGIYMMFLFVALVSSYQAVYGDSNRAGSAFVSSMIESFSNGEKQLERLEGERP